MIHPKRQLLWLIPAVCLLWLSALCAADSFPELVIPNGFGVNIHFTGAPKDLDLIKEGGFKFIRMDFAWSGVERRKGEYNFERYDELTSGLLERGIRPLYILDYSNRLYEENQSVRTDEGRQGFAAFAAAAAKRYAGKGIIWEIWNEPNIKQFWKPEPNAEDYAKLVEAAAPRIKEADPGALVVAPATSQIPLPWIEQCFERGMLKHIDGVSVHPYRPQAPETVLADYEKLRELIRKYAPEGKTIPILSGEWGYSNVNWNNARISDEQQARFLAREFLTNLYAKVPVSIWYDWKNDGTDANEREHNFGTMSHDLAPEPAWKAAKVLADTLNGYSIESRIDVGSEQDFVLRLKKGDAVALAFWTTGEPHEVSIEMPAGKGTQIEMLGESKEISWEGNALKLNLAQGPRYLLIP